MEVTLTPHAEELPRTALARHPGRSPADILEQALSERLERETATRPSARLLEAKKLNPKISTTG
ncbi:MAG: hypothetical protein M3Y07_02255 [Acidobacteriota bacterium]|nr:hypothetical protein [Acidobacteriota bacterium]